MTGSNTQIGRYCIDESHSANGWCIMTESQTFELNRVKCKTTQVALHLEYDKN